ncbi:unnamed protein product [Bemisia tabaci]|uniref:Centrosomin N-terminal motif 1 domain-containing protein n=1 Tax=Bemisia tabaci TaxID=7038 RepID=A0A9P0AD35_BEMTA|nr:unnamed protein product [Bemisia tabaci]
MEPNIEDLNGKSCIFDETAVSTPGVGGSGGFSLKEYEEQLNALKKENFNLKLRIYFAEERKEQMKSIKSIEEATQKILDLSVELETLRKELSEKDELLVETAKAMDVLQRSYQTKTESLQILSVQKAQLETQNQTLRKDLLDLKRKLVTVNGQISSPPSSSSQSQLDLKKKKSSVACQPSFSEHKTSVATSPCKSADDSPSENASLREQLTKVLVENTKAMKTIQYLMHVNKRLRQQKKDTSSSAQDQNEEQTSDSGRTAELKAEIERLNSELADANRTAHQLRQEVKKVSCDASEKVKESSHLERCIEEKDALINKLNQELRELELKLELVQLNEKEDLAQQLREKETENIRLKSQLQKHTYNLQELVNKELWSKNREIEKLNKLAERRQSELLSLKTALKRTANVEVLAPRMDNLSVHLEDKENVGNRFVLAQLETALEEVTKLSGKVAQMEIAERKLMEQCHEARTTAEIAEKQLKESTNACHLLTTRLEELAGFLDSLISQNASLSEEKRRILQEAVTQSRLLSKSLSASFMDGTYAESGMELSLKCPSVEPILPDYSEINFSSEEDALAEVELETLQTGAETKEPSSKAEGKEEAELNLLRSEVVALTEQLNSVNLEVGSASDCPSLPNFCADFAQRCIPVSGASKFDPMFSVTGKSLESPTSRAKRFADYGGSCGSESEVWSEPDRCASLARIGLSKESMAGTNQCSETETSDLEDISKLKLSGKQSKKIYGKSMKQKLRLFEEMNSSLRQEIQSLHGVIATVSNKISDEEFVRQLRSLNSQLSSSHSKCAILEKQLIMANTRCQTLLVLLEDAQLKSKDAAQREARKGHISQETIHQLETQVKGLEAQLAESTSELGSLSQLKNDYNAMTQELSQVKSALAEEKTAHAATQETVSQLRVEIKQVQAHIQTQKECILEKECALLEAQNRLKECAIEFELRTKETQEWNEKRVKEVENSLCEATAKLHAAEAKVEELSGRLMITEREFRETERKLEETKMRLGQRESEAMTLRREVGTLRSEANETKMLLDQRETELNTLKAQCEKEVTGLKSELESFRAEETHNAELHRRVLMEMSQQIETLKRERAEALELVQTWRAKVDALVREKAEMADCVDAIKAEQEVRAEQLNKAEKVARETEAGLRYQLQAASSQCAYAETHTRTLEKQYKLRERELKSWFAEREAELRRQLDHATLTTSEVVLERTRLANDKLRLQQELRNRTHYSTGRHGEELERVKRELERRVAELEAANGELESKLANLYVYKESYSDGEATSAGEESLLGSPVQIAPLNVDTVNDAQTSQRLKTCISTLTYNHIYLRQRSNENSSDYVSDQELALPLQMTEKNMDVGTCSPDLGIESDQGRASSSDQVTLCKSSSEVAKLEEENVTLRNKLLRTKQALEETLNQLSTANKKKRQVESAICRQLHKTHHILKKARVNLELRSESTQLVQESTNPK